MSLVSRCLDAFAREAKEVSRSVDAQVSILGDLLRSFARPLGEISFGQRLQPPSNPPKQLLSVFAACLFLKSLLIFPAQLRHRCPAQALDLPQYGRVHLKLFSSLWR